MLNSWTAALPAALLLVATFGNFQEASGGEALTCEDDKLKINSSEVVVSTDIFSACGNVIAAPINRKHPVFLDDCDRWMGETDNPKANYRMRYHVDRCQDNGDGTLTYYGSVCCKDTTVKLRCFECYNFKDVAECMNKGTAVECDPEHEVCRTTVRYLGQTGVGEGVTILRSTYCAPRDPCYEAREASKDDCKNWSGAVNPECTFCCDTPFCNYNQDKIPTLKNVGPDPCSVGKSRCKNGGTCESSGSSYKCICPVGYTGTKCQLLDDDPCKPNPCNSGVCNKDKKTGTATCDCPVGWHGDLCQDAYLPCPTNDYCANGGQCFDHEENGYRCRCRPGYLGLRCDLKKMMCSDEHFYMIGDVETDKKTDCSETVKKLQTKLDKLGKCPKYIASLYKTSESYKEGKHGPPLKLEDRSMDWCLDGDTKIIGQNAYCCPTCLSLPCHNNGWCTQKENGDYVCKCRAGWYGKNCELKSNLCMVSGDPHYMQFDGITYSFQGVPGFVLVRAKDGSFSVVGVNEAVGPVSYLKEMVVEVCGHTVELLQGRQVFVDGSLVDPWSHYEKDCFGISVDGNMVRLETDFDLVVSFDGDEMASVQVSDAMLGQIEGLCGTFDGDPTNDLNCKDGSDCSDDTDEFGLSWADDDDASVPDFDKDCTAVEAEAQQYCDQYIGNDGPFDDCFLANGFSFDFHRESCRLDLCAGRSEPKEAACKYMTTLATICISGGHVVGDWRGVTGCGLVCEAPLVPVYGGYACHASCQNPNAESTCPYPNTDVCKCPDGLVRNGEDCVDPSTCGCVTLDGQTYEIGESWISDDCSTLYKCEEDPESDYPEVGRLKSEDYVCPVLHKCEPISDTRGECVPTLVCPAGTTYERVAPCPNMCTHLGDPESCTQLTGDNRQACVCPDGKLLQDDMCLDISDCPCVDDDLSRQPGQTWEHAYPCVSTRECKDGVVTESTSVCHEDERCLLSCDHYVIKFEDIILDATTDPITVMPGQDYTLTATSETSVNSIILVKSTGGIPDTVQCDSTDECDRVMSFVPADGAMADSFVGAVITDGNTKIQVMVPVNIAGSPTNDQCP